MEDWKEKIRKICRSRRFELVITAIIIVNSTLIGLETYVSHPAISVIQDIILVIFTFEIVMRMIAAKNLREFFRSGWNVFDLFLVLITYVPESLVPNSSAMMIIRLLRVFRVLRLLRASKEIKLIVTVLLKSMTAMFYNMLLFLVFIYLFGIIGVGLFRMPDPETLSGEEAARYEEFMRVAPNNPNNSTDPYGSLDEAMFTLFRAMTGEDWTDLRYNLVTASKMGVIKTPSAVVTLFHVFWFVIAAFLLLNLVTGAILNNYQKERSRQDVQECEEDS
ncbi:MAG: ion transporter [Paludibacteraceae bacterium]|nr:ion transporter [Paludibacteraceae bacterium]MBR5373652.1 ion transporter [Paludibacteraceae bacterium]